MSKEAALRLVDEREVGSSPSSFPSFDSSFISYKERIFAIIERARAFAGGGDNAEKDDEESQLQRISLDDKMQGVIDTFEMMSRPSEGKDAMYIAHMLFLDSVYPQSYLQVVQGVRESLEGAGVDIDMRFSKALSCLMRVTNEVGKYAIENEITPYEAFMELYDEAVRGGNTFLMQLNIARAAAVEFVRSSRYLLKDEAAVRDVDGMLDLNEEVEHGLKFPQEFVERLNNPSTKALVLSLDFNSTFNLDESYPSPDLVADVQRKLQALARSFKRFYPNKELVMAINTGRPAMYAWGVVEAAFSPMPELRKVAVGESGGVILEEGFNDGKMNVAVDNPYEWRKELDSIRDYLVGLMKGAKDVVVEPKLSMLSIKISDGEDFCLESVDDETITPEWIEENLRNYFISVESALREELAQLSDEIMEDLPNMKIYLGKVAEALNSINDDGEFINGGKDRAMGELSNVIAHVKEDHERRIADIQARFEILKIMYDQGLLQVKYNPTAGYIDIWHAHLNKYSTLMGHVCKKSGLTPDQVLYVQVGDSTTDIIPDELTEKGEPNEGANEAYLIALANRNQKLDDAVKKRGAQGLTTLQPSILGAQAMFVGLKNLMKEQPLVFSFDRLRAV